MRTCSYQRPLLPHDAPSRALPPPARRCPRRRRTGARAGQRAAGSCNLPARALCLLEALAQRALHTASAAFRARAASLSDACSLPPAAAPDDGPSSTIHPQPVLCWLLCWLAGSRACSRRLLLRLRRLPAAAAATAAAAARTAAAAAAVRTRASSSSSSRNKKGGPGLGGGCRARPPASCAGALAQRTAGQQQQQQGFRRLQSVAGCAAQAIAGRGRVVRPSDAAPRGQTRHTAPARRAGRRRPERRATPPGRTLVCGRCV
jgi:hypothetical protein